MLDMHEVDEAIEELENGETTMENCQKLAILYIIKGKHEEPQDATDSDVSSQVIQEYKDILPSYAQYCRVKGQYQLGEIQKERVIAKFELLCKEITEFIQMLYSTTDSEAERDEIKSIAKYIETYL